MLLPTGNPFAQTANSILMERWDGITGTTVSSLTGNANYPNNPSSRSYPTLYELATGSGDNYGTRTRGYVTAPTTGNYIFWIAGDDNCELWLGTNDQASTARVIASVPDWTNSREWTKFSQQQSAAIALTAGTRYYIETRHKEGTGGDNLAVGWQLPAGTQERPIPGTRLAPFLLSTPPSITTQPVSQAVNVGQTASFSVVAAGTAPLSYQWRKNGTNISGATSASYTTPATVAADDGALFSVVVTNAAGTATSANATLTVRVAPSFTTQPANQTVTEGQTATFTVVAAGTAPLSYQWRKNGTNISGATSASYTTPATVLADSGALFSVLVTNVVGTATSSNATLTVNRAPVAPSITTQPASQTVNVGQTAAFSVVAAGTAPLSYQWRRNGTNISGATSASYTTPATVASDDGALYSVVVTNSVGTATSASATLTVRVAPTITTQPANRTVDSGQTAAFSVVAAGTAPLTYQWRRNGTNIAGATSAGYTTPATVPADDGALFSVVVTNVVGSVTSTNATLTVRTRPSITAQPANQTVTEGQTATFTVVAAGTAPLSYQWRKNGTNISGATSASYTTPATVLADSGALFSVVVTNAAGSATSANAILTVNPVPVAPTITAQPANRTVDSGQTAAFTVVAAGTATLTYQWRRNGANISGATSASYTTPATVPADDGALFSVVVSNSAGSVTSANATLTVRTRPSISSQPANQTVTEGQTATFTVVAAGTAPLAYQWRRNGTNISGATSASYTTPATVLADSGDLFSVVVTNAAGSATSADATLMVNAASPVIVQQPVSQTVQPGRIASFQVQATGAAPLAYQWLRNGVAISGASSASYSTTPATLGDSGAVFTCRVSNAGGQTLSSGAVLSVVPAGAVPTSELVSVSGRLSDNTGAPLGSATPAAIDLVVRLFPSKTGGSVVHTESFLAANSQAVSVQNGFFVARLGEGASTQNVLDVLAAQPSVYAEFQVGTGGSAEVLSPRIPVTTPAYIGAPNFSSGASQPVASAKVGSVYRNTSDNSLWYRVPDSWVRISN